MISFRTPAALSLSLLLFSALSCSNAPSGTAPLPDSDSARSILHRVEKPALVFYEAGDNRVELCYKRPSKNDTAIRLCIAAAFTQLENDQIDGLYICKGKIIHSGVNHHLGGGLLVNGNSVSIIKTVDGTLLTKNFIDSICKAGCSFLQQIQLVRDSAKLDFHRDQKLFQRRAFVLFSDGRKAVAESTSDITLDAFAAGLVERGVVNAIYTDMGGWDEGWLRNPENGELTVIGTALTSTSRQSNWLVFSR